MKWSVYHLKLNPTRQSWIQEPTINIDRHSQGRNKLIKMIACHTSRSHADWTCWLCWNLLKPRSRELIFASHGDVRCCDRTRETRENPEDSRESDRESQSPGDRPQSQLHTPTFAVILIKERRNARILTSRSISRERVCAVVASLGEGKLLGRMEYLVEP